MTTILQSNSFKDHETGDHPENPARITAIESALNTLTTSETQHFSVVTCELPPTLDADSQGVVTAEALLTLVHSPPQIAAAKSLCRKGGGSLDPDTKTSARSFDVAVLAASTAAQAVDIVMGGRDKNALCFMRPPGHHATQNKSMGFCLFNNIAIAARYAQKKYGLHNILIVDWDVHHGNGTQDIFYEDDSVTFMSIHRFPFYPGSGSESETGSGKGLGSTINIPVAYGTSRARYLELFKDGLERSAARSRPELILLSAGFDAHHLDPVGNLGLETEDYAVMTQSLQEVASTYCQGRLVSCLEGGYHLQALADSAMTHLVQLNQNPCS